MNSDRAVAPIIIDRPRNFIDWKCLPRKANKLKNVTNNSKNSHLNVCYLSVFQNMSTVVQAVRFGNLAEQLTDAEFIQLLVETVKKCGKIFMSRALIAKSLTIQQSDEGDVGTVSQMISLIKSLIQKREHSSNTTSLHSAKISFLVAPLIGSIASYLHQKEHARFGLVSRRIYICCNTPNTLRDLNAIRINRYADHSTIDVRRHSQVRILRFPLRKFKLLRFPSSGRVCRHLIKLELDNRSHHRLYNLDEFMGLQSINFLQITHLTLRNFSSPKTSDFIKLLSLFPNLNSLSLNRVHLQPFMTEELVELKGLLPNLEVFVVRFTEKIPTIQIANTFANELRAIHFAKYLDDCVYFKSLEEICTNGSSGCVSALNRMMQNGSSLKRVFVDGIVASRTPLLSDLISKQQTLEQLIIGAAMDQLESVCTAIEKGIFGIADERYQLQIKLWIGGDISITEGDYDVENVINQISRVMEALESSVEIQHFVFIWRFWKFQNKRQYPQWKKHITDILESGNSFDISYDARNIVITNKDCKIDGKIHNYLTDDWLSQSF